MYCVLLSPPRAAPAAMPAHPQEVLAIVGWQGARHSLQSGLLPGANRFPGPVAAGGSLWSCCSFCFGQLLLPVMALGLQPRLHTGPVTGIQQCFGAQILAERS